MPLRLFSDSASRVEDPFLRHALALACRARGSAWPNPLVGCVVVRDGRIVGEGFHPRAGQPHAEVFALADAGEAAAGADVYVTLEPCRHHGRTPPCTDALIASGVSRVVIGMADPNPEAGGGAHALRAAGIEVEFASDPSPFAEINEGWLKRMATGTPFVSVKVGVSLDGCIALEPGHRSSMTGPSGSQVTARLRSQADAVMVGVSTVLADDPALTVRDADGTAAENQPLRIVLGRSAAPPADARVLSDGAAPTLVVLPEGVEAPNGVQVAHYDAAAGLSGALRVLGDRGVGTVLVEAGPTLLSALWREGLVDELIVVTAGGMAGDGALSLFAGDGDSVGESLVHLFSPVDTGIVGDVSVTVWRPREEAPDVERKGS